MESLLNMLLEAKLSTRDAEKLVDRGNQVSIFYDKKWLKVEPARVETIDKVYYLIAFDVANPKAKEPNRYEIDKVTNWNVLSKKSADRGAEEKKKAPAASSLDKIGQSVVNKRVVSFYYKGDKENAPGFREEIKPVAYGVGKNGRKYLRAWQDKGETYRGKLPTDDKQYRPMPGWRLFRVDRISMSSYKEVGTETFSEPPEEYNRHGDKMIDKMIAMAEFDGYIFESENKIISAILEAVRIF
jgi:predicted DNA-binding transcriptional regulator YafY